MKHQPQISCPPPAGKSHHHSSEVWQYLLHHLVGGSLHVVIGDPRAVQDPLADKLPHGASQAGDGLVLAHENADHVREG